MSTSVQSYPTAHDSGKTALRPEARQAVERMQEAITDLLGESLCTLTDNGIEFPGLYGQSSLSATPIEIDTVDGQRISERLEARTVLNSAFNELGDNFLPLANTYATTGVAIRCPDTGKAMIVSSIPVFEVDIRALHDLYAPLIIWSAVIQAFGVQQALRHCSGTDCLGDQSNGRWLEYFDEPSHWWADEFEYAKTMLDAGGIFCNASETRLSAEFPWAPDSVSAIVGDRTSLLQFDSQAEHPTAGNGLAFRLALPVSGTDEELLEFAETLNRIEIEGIDVPPCLGAWCLLEPIHSVAYAGFWPNCVYQRGTVANIATWCLNRSRIARQVLGSLN